MSFPDWEDPRRVLRRHGIAPKKRFSQNFLVSRSAVERIADAIQLQADDRVVELGPGVGTLTGELLRRGARVHAVERDVEMIRILGEELTSDALHVVEGDAATVDLSELANGSRLPVTGNLPYAITGAILRNVIAHRSAVRCAVVMVQREVQGRLTATPGSKAYGALSVFSQAAFEIQPVLRLGPGSFFPPPKVDSAVVRLEVRETPRAAERESFRAVVQAAFGQRRKTLRNALGVLGRDASADILQAAGIDGSRRAETLSVEEFDALARALENVHPSTLHRKVP